MTPREMMAFALGVVIGALLNARQKPCHRGCCVTENRRQRWREGQDIGEPPRRPHNMIEDPKRIHVAQPNPAAHNHLYGTGLGACCEEARNEAHRVRFLSDGTTRA